MITSPLDSPAGKPPPSGRGLNAADGTTPDRAAAPLDAADPRHGIRGTPSRGVPREGATAGPGTPLPGPAWSSLPVLRGSGGAREEGPGGTAAPAGSPPAGEPGGGARLRTAALPPGTRPLAAWEAALSANAAGRRRRRGGKPAPVVPAGSGRLRTAGPREGAFDDAPLPSLRLRPPPEPPEAAL